MLTSWLRSILLGALVGLHILGIGGRAAMRAIAVTSGAPALFTPEGTITVLLAGAGSGALAGGIHRLLMAVLPRRRLARDLVFLAVLAALTVRGLHPVDPQRLVLFGGLVVLFAAAFLTASQRSRMHAVQALQR